MMENNGQCENTRPPLRDLGMCMLMVLIIDQKHTRSASELLQTVGVMRSTCFLAHGSAKRNWLEMLGITDDEKSVIIGVVRESLVYAAFKMLRDEFCLLKQGAGIAFTLPLLAHNGLRSLYRMHEKMHHELSPELRKHLKEKLLVIKEKSEMDAESIKEIKKSIDPADHVMLMSIVNRGFSGEVIDAARDAGAQGATTLHGRGLGHHESEKFFNIRVEPEKEVVLIVLEKAIARKVMEAINEVSNLQTKSKAVSFALPVSEVFGLTPMDMETGE